MSSPSASSGSSFQTRYQESATSSGRTTPDPSHHAHSSSYNPSKAMAMAHPQPQPPRRSSTPASSFLAPRFFGGYPYDSMVAANANSQQASSNTSGAGGSGSGAPNGPPRRTSFGTSLGGRLSALSSLGLGGGAWSQPPTSPSLQNQQPASQTSSATASPMLRPADKAAAAPVTASTEGGKPRGAQQVEKRHICVPDGCGGFVTVERRDRRPSQA